MPYVPGNREPQQEVHRPIPVKTPASEAAAKQRRVGLDSLSIYDHEPDFDEIVKSLTGKEPVYHDHTGELVLKPTSAPQRPAG
jgi:hypothetical protein